MAEDTSKVLATGKLAIDGKLRSVNVLAATLSFKKTEEGDAKIYDAEEIAADTEILSALVKSKSSYVTVIYSDTDEDAPVQAPAEASASGNRDVLAQINDGLQKKVEALTTANALLTKENDDYKAHIELLEAEIEKLKTPAEVK